MAATAALLLSSPSGVRAQSAGNASGMSQAPLIEADKTPTRVRPAAPKPKAAPAMQVPVQGIPTMPALQPPADADVVVAPGKPAKPRAGKPSASRSKSFKVQLASARTAAGAARQAERLRQRYGAPIAELGLRVERAPHGLYRVVSQAMPEQRRARDVCAAVAARHGSCLVVASHTTAAHTQVAATEGARGTGSVRAQLASLRSYEGATRELERLTRRYSDLLDRNALTISRIDQAGRGTFYRVLTAPLPDRSTAAGLCHRIALQAGCVLVPGRQRDAWLIPPGADAESV